MGALKKKEPLCPVKNTKRKLSKERTAKRKAAAIKNKKYYSICSLLWLLFNC